MVRRPQPLLSLAVVVFELAALSACSGRPSLLPERKGGAIYFRVETADARRVALVGTFNRWNPTANLMTRRDGEIWETAVALPRGRFSYTFLVNDRPVRPPEAILYEDDGFGGENGVIEVY